MEKHWTDENLIDRLYGVGPEGDHLARCGECALRFEALVVRKRVVTRAPDIPASLLVEQRTAIYGRLDRPQFGWKAVPALAGVCALALVLIVQRPPAPTVSTTAISDAQFFSEVSSVIQSPEPAVAEPIRGLFKGGQ